MKSSSSTWPLSAFGLAGRQALFLILGVLTLGSGSAWGQAATTTAFTSSSVNPSFITQFTVLVATVTGSNPSGAVTFKDNGVSIGSAGLSAGVASLNVSFAAAGTHTLTAVYSGDIANAGSTSGSFAQTVKSPGATTTTFTSSSVNPSFITQYTVLMATVTGSNPSGAVTFKDNGVSIGSAGLSAGVASLNVSFAAAGTHTLTAVYGGDIANAGSTSGTFTQTVNNPGATTTALTSSINPTVATQSTTLRATITGTNPTGTVTFKDNGVSIGSVGVSAGGASLTTSFSTAGAHSLTAAYGGDTTNAASTSPTLTQTVNAPGTTTTTMLASSVNPAFMSQSTTLTATVTGSGPTGAVTFKDNGVSIGTAWVTSGVATVTTAFTSAGAHSLTASYPGDSGNTASTSAPVTETVNARTTSTTTIASSINPSSLNQSVMLTATVTGSSPSGSVTFMDAGTTLGTGTLAAGTATFNTTFTALGSHSLSAVYTGDAPNTGSTSSALAQSVVPGNMTWLLGYDAAGNLTTATNPISNVTTKTYDQLQRLTRVVQPPPATAAPLPTINIGYDGQDNVTSVQDPRSLTTSYVPDGLANIQTQTSPDTGATNATYDAAGNLLTQTDARGKTSTYTYDVLNRVKTINYQTGVGTTFEYDGGAAPYPGSIGKLTKMTDESGVTTFTYDTLGRLIGRSALVGARTLTTAYTWGATGTIASAKVTSITYPSGARVNYSFDTAGRVQALTVNPPNANGVGTNTGAYLNILSGITYNADNNFLGWTWADSAPYLRTYDSFGRLDAFPVGYPLGTGIAAGLARTLAYDNAGRVIAFTHVNNAGAQATFDQYFGYDGLDRLVQQSTWATPYNFTYDATGNRTSLTIGANTYANTVSATSNQLSVVQTFGTGGPVNNTQTYTASGSLSSDGTVTYAYSARGRMSSSTTGAQTTTYKYNGLEQRVSKTGALVPTGAAYYSYDEDGKTIGEYDANLVPVAETVYIGTTPVVVFKETGAAASSTIQISIGNVYADQIDTPRVITRNSDEAIMWRWDVAEVFGSSPALENPSGLGVYKYNQRMPGQVFDAETQNFYNLNRDYQTRTGRYVQSDPIGLNGGINTYAYVGGNPLSWTDPSGLGPIGEAIGGGIGTWGGRIVGGAVGAAVPVPGGTVIGSMAGGYAGKRVGGAIGSAIGDFCSPGDPDPCKGLRDQLNAHENKLKEYLNNPLGPSDNTNILNWAVLANNGTAASSIYEGRIRNLQNQIANFKLQLEECERKNGKR